MFDIRYDRDRDILHLRQEGFWTQATVARFGAALLAQTVWLRMRRRPFQVLSDARLFPVQDVKVAAALDNLTVRGAELGMRTRETALVVGSVLAKMQAERVMTSGDVAVFLDCDAAMAWLDEKREHRRAA